MAPKIRPKGGTAAALKAANPFMAQRELIVEHDTGKAKIGPAGGGYYNDLINLQAPPLNVIVCPRAIQGNQWSGPQYSFAVSPKFQGAAGFIDSLGNQGVFVLDPLLQRNRRIVANTNGEPDDHSPAIALNTPKRPAVITYRHNKDRKLGVQVGVIPGDFTKLAPIVQLSLPNPSDISGNVTYCQAALVPEVSPYYQDWLVVTRIAWHWFIGTIRIDQLEGAITVPYGWKDLITFNVDATVTGGDQGYITLSPTPDGKFRLGVGSHPTMALAPSDRNIYFGIIDPVTGDVAGRGNYITGVGLPIRRTALEVAYQDLPNQGVRFFKIGGGGKEALGLADWPEIGGVAQASNYRLFRPNAAPAVPGLSMTTSGFVSSANRASYNQGSVDIRVLVVPTSTRPAAAGEMLSKWSTTGANRGERFILNTDGTLTLSYSIDGTAISTRTSTLTVPASVSVGWGCRVDYDGATGTAKFYTTSDSGITWTQLGADVTGTAGTIATTTASLQVGRTSGSPVSLAGIYQRVTLRPLGGSPVADIDFTRGIPNGAGVGTSVRDYLTQQWALQANTTIIARTWSGVDLGPTGANVGYDDDTKYVGGMDVPPVDGVAYFVTEAAGTWSALEAAEVTAGNFTFTTMYETSTHKLMRPTCVLGGGPYSISLSRISYYEDDYTVFESDLLLVGPPEAT